MHCPAKMDFYPRFSSLYIKIHIKWLCDNNSDQDLPACFFIHRSRKLCSSALLFGFCINDDYCGAAIAKQIDGVHHSFCAQFDQLHTYIHIVHFVSVASDRHRSPSLPLVKHNRVGTVLFILTAVRKRDLKTDNKIQLTLWEHWWNKAGSRLWWMSIFVKLSIAVLKFATF